MIIEFSNLFQKIIETWNDRAYVHKDGKFQKEDERREGTRLDMMGRITYELQRFQKHNDHVEWWKKVWVEMKENLPQIMSLSDGTLLVCFIFILKKKKR